MTRRLGGIGSRSLEVLASFSLRFFLVAMMVFVPAALMGCGGDDTSTVTASDGGSDGSVGDATPDVKITDANNTDVTDAKLPTTDAEAGVGPKTLIAVQVTPPTATIHVGTTAPTQAYVATANFSDGSNLDVTGIATWTSSDVTTATVTAGLATGLKAGSATISAAYTAAGVTKTGAATLVISPAALVSITVAPQAQSIAAGSTLQYQAKAVYADSTQVDVTSQATWTSSTVATATINSLGLATAVATGTTTITAAFGGMSGTSALTVSTAVVNTISISPNPGATNLGGLDVQFTATAAYSDGTQGDVTTQATWSSGTPATATVGSATGLAHPLAAGTSVITATLQGKSGTAVLTVGTAPLTSVTISATPLTIPAAFTTQFTATATYGDGSHQDVTSQATWQSSVPGVATISPLGLAHGVIAGTTSITASFGGMTSTGVTLTVTGGVLTSIAISPSSPQSIPLGLTVAFTATGTFSDQTTADISTQVGWNTTPMGILTFTGATAQGTAAGTTTVTASLSGITSNPTTVQVTNATLVSIAITPALPTSLHLGATQQFMATGTFTSGPTHDLTSSVVWASSTPATATILSGVANAGRATGVAAGTTTITATSGTITSPPVTLTVISPTLVTIILTPSALTTLPVGGTQQFTATGVYSDNTTGDVTATASWSAIDNEGDPATADFTAVGGLVTGVHSTVGLTAGALTADQGLVKATLAGVSGTAPVKITSTTIATVSILCTSPNSGAPGTFTCIPPGLGFQVSCSATAHFTDSSTADVTSSATWASSDTALAVPAGVVAGTPAHELLTIAAVGTGTTNITAAVGAITSPPVTVTSQAGQTIGAALTVTPTSNPLSLGQTSTTLATAAFTGTGACGLNNFNVTTLATWTSSDATIASVSNAAGSNGLVSAIAAGTATIAAAFQGHSGNYGATVNSACLQSLTVDQTGATYPSSVIVPLTVKAVFSNSATPVQLSPGTAPGNVGTWSGAPVTVIGGAWELDTTALSGAITPTFTIAGGCAGAVAGVATLTIDSTTLPTGLTITPATTTISLGGSVVYTATATYPGNLGTFNVSRQAQVAASWTEVPASGTLSFGATTPPSLNELLTHGGATGAGTYTVSAVYRNQTANASLTVNATRTVTSVTVAPSVTGTSATTVPIGLPITFHATVLFSDGSTSLDPNGVTFASDTAGILSAFTGNVATTAIAGVTHVTATFNGVASTPVAITSTADPLVTIAANNATIPKNDTVPVQVLGTYTSSAVFDLSTLVSSSSSDSSIVSITTTASGTSVTSHSTAAAATLTFIKDGVTGHATITVNLACITGLTISPASVTSLAQGTSQTFVATATLSDATTPNVTGPATWSPTDTHLTKVANGQYTALGGAPALGADTVTATFTGPGVCAGGNAATTTVSASVPVTVTAATVQSIAINVTGLGNGLATANIPFNETRQLVALATLTDNTTQDVTAQTTFLAGTPTVASVSASGLVTSHAIAGASIIQANYAPTNVSSQVTFTVANCGAPTVSIAGTSPVGSGNLAVGLTNQYRATASYSNGAGPCSGFLPAEVAFNPITALATWASGTPANVTINTGATNPGLATVVQAGASAITATYKGVTSNTITLTGITPTLTTLAITVAHTTVAKGLTEAITVTPTWSDGGSYPISVSFTFDPNVISVNGSNQLTALTAGMTQLQAHAVSPVNSLVIDSNIITVTVSTACISGLTLSSSLGTTLPAGVPFTVAFGCTTSDGSVLACPTPVFSSTNTGAVDNAFAGFAGTGHARINPVPTVAATDTITATIPIAGQCPAVTATLNVTAGAATLQSIALTPATATIPVQTSQTYSSAGTYATGTGAGTYDLSSVAGLGSNNGTVATTSGVVATATATPGTALLTSTYNGVTSNTASLTTNTTKVLLSIAVTADENLVGGGAGSAQYPAGGYNLQLHATGSYNDATTADLTSQVTWALVAGGTTGSSVSATGLFSTGNTGGAENVRATLGTVVSPAFTVTVVGGAVTAPTIVNANNTATANPFNVSNGSQAALAAQVTVGASQYWVTQNFTWASSVPAVATVVVSGTGAGTVQAVTTTGTTTVSAVRGPLTAGGLVVTATAATPTSIVCGPATVAVSVGGSAHLHATVTFSDGSMQDETTSGNTAWPAVAHTAFNGVNDGIVSGVSTGPATISPHFTQGATTVIATGPNSCVVTVN